MHYLEAKSALKCEPPKVSTALIAMEAAIMLIIAGLLVQLFAL